VSTPEVSSAKLCATRQSTSVFSASEIKQWYIHNHVGFDCPGEKEEFLRWSEDNKIIWITACNEH